jgi:hypothetical protein
MDGVPNNPPEMNAAFLTSSSEGVNVTKKPDDGNEMRFFCNVWFDLQLSHAMRGVTKRSN